MSYCSYRISETSPLLHSQATRRFQAELYDLCSCKDVIMPPPENLHPRDAPSRCESHHRTQVLVSTEDTESKTNIDTFMAVGMHVKRTGSFKTLLTQAWKKSHWLAYGEDGLSLVTVLARPLSHVVYSQTQANMGKLTQFLTSYSRSFQVCDQHQGNELSDWDGITSATFAKFRLIFTLIRLHLLWL